MLGVRAPCLVAYVAGLLAVARGSIIVYTEEVPHTVSFSQDLMEHISLYNDCMLSATTNKLVIGFLG